MKTLWWWHNTNGNVKIFGPWVGTPDGRAKCSYTKYSTGTDVRVHWLPSASFDEFPNLFSSSVSQCSENLEKIKLRILERTTSWSTRISVSFLTNTILATLLPCDAFPLPRYKTKRCLSLQSALFLTCYKLWWKRPIWLSKYVIKSIACSLV